MNASIDKLVELIANSKHIAVLTGAGMSTESGIPDFRSQQGIYKTIASEEVFDIDRFMTDPDFFFTNIGPVNAAMIDATPNEGHKALVAFETEFGKNVCVATQNIDGLHQKAGSTDVCEVHGTLATMTCMKCHKHFRTRDFYEACKLGKRILCLECGGILKPDITFYGEALPEDAFTRAADAFTNCDLAMVLGTSLAVYPAASLPSYYKSRISPLVIINNSPTPLDNQAAVCIHSGIGETMKAVLEGLRK